MKLQEENKTLRYLVLQLNAYIPHRCYNCKHCVEDYCVLHDRPTINNDGCGCFDMEIYETAKKLGIEL
jgi:hypothetical protein